MVHVVGGPIDRWQKIIRCRWNKSPTVAIKALLAGNTNMRAFALGLILSTAALPCAAQTVLKSEPFILAPVRNRFRAARGLSGRAGAQGHRRDPGPAPQEGVRDYRAGASDAVGRHALTVVVPAKVGTHNPLALVGWKIRSNKRLPRALTTRRMGPRLSGDDMKLRNPAEIPVAVRARPPPGSLPGFPADPPGMA